MYFMMGGSKQIQYALMLSVSLKIIYIYIYLVPWVCLPYNGRKLQRFSEYLAMYAHSLQVIEES